jgi:hypothetical protein
VDFKEMNLRVFQRKPIPQVFFQPRIEPWFHWHSIFNKFPEGFEYSGILDLFDDLGASIRYIHYYTGMPDPIVRVFSPQVEFIRKEINNIATNTYHTPHGVLTETQHLTIDLTWRTTGFAVKNTDDLHALKWLYEHTEYHFDERSFITGKNFIGVRGEPQFWVPKSPYQALAQIWMKLPDLVYAIVDHKKIVEEVMEAIDNAYDPLYEEICSSKAINIVNFGENIHEQLLTPRYLDNYLLPFWGKRTDQLQTVGIYSHVHIDGFFRNLLAYLQFLPFDGIEALTPEPQGDMKIEEIKEHIGDKILIDGIPAVLFLETYKREQLLSTTEKIIKLFYPNLILGISDELPQGAGIEAIERVRLVSEFCAKYQLPVRS